MFRIFKKGEKKINYFQHFILWSDACFYSENEKVEGEELQEWLKLVVAPKELTIFIGGKQDSLLPVQAGSG